MKNFSRRYFLALAMLAALPWAFPAQSPDKPANNMEILRDKLKADKKLLVATNMELNSVSDEKAKKLTDEYVSIQQAEANLTTSFVPKLTKALPAKKVARYLQIENKIRAVIKYDLASTVPLVQ